MTSVQARRDAIRAVRLGDKAFLIRSGCCAPARCAPAANLRCCLSATCNCDWPDLMYRGMAPAPARDDRRGLVWALTGASAVVVVSFCSGVAYYIGRNLGWALATGALFLFAVAAVRANLRRTRVTVIQSVTIRGHR